MFRTVRDKDGNNKMSFSCLIPVDFQVQRSPSRRVAKQRFQVWIELYGFNPGKRKTCIFQQSEDLA